MNQDERKYIEARAEQELKMAQQAKDRRALDAHYQLASRYLDLLYPPGAADGVAEFVQPQQVQENRRPTGAEDYNRETSE